MKPLLLAIAALALCWFALSRFNTSAESSPVAPPSPSTRSNRPNPPAPLSSAQSITTREAGPTTQPAVASEESKPIRETAAPYPQMSLANVLLPDNGFYDAVFGVSATYPQGWSVRQAMRWGENNRENTVFFSPAPGSRAVPSMYYQMYPEGAPVSGNTEAYLRDVAQKKEEQRTRGGLLDYQNHPDSFVFREIDGRPTLSYFATYTRNDEVQAEYFMRVLGQKGYVMFFVRGPAKDVQAIIPDVYQMGGTVRVP